jgi:carboxylesterase type B
MRSVPVEDLVTFPTSNHAHFPLSPILDWSPVVDGVTVERRPLDAVQQGSFNDAADVIIGTAKNDGSMFAMALPLLSDKYGLPETMLREFLDRVFGPDAGKAILRQFPKESYVLGAYPQVDELITDYLFRCSARRFSRALASQGRPAWLYEFAYAFQGKKHWLLGDYHTSENKWLFGGKGSDLHLTGADAAMQAALQGYWGNFSASGDPNGAAARDDGADSRSPAQLPSWPPVSEAHPSIMILTQDPAAAPAAGASSAPREVACDFWDTLPPLMHGWA